MKEQIYTIPVNEVYDEDYECPLCELQKKLECESLEYTLGAAMMEPDFRQLSNKSGFCRHHFEKLFEMPNKLALSLVLDTHLEEIRKSLSELSKKTKVSSVKKSGLFKKNNASEFGEKLSGKLSEIESGCIVCDKINRTMERYADVLLYMWANELEFKEKFNRSKGVCLRHMKLLSDMSEKSLPKSQASEFLDVLYQKQNEELNRIQEDIHKFTLKFDYRNKDMQWGTAHDAPIRAIEKISGYIKNDTEGRN